jgi:hypothetical protein
MTPNVRPDPDYLDGCYIIEFDGGYSCLGFDNALDRVERYALDLTGDVEVADQLMARLRPLRGTMAVYDEMRDLERELAERGDAVADLTPQLAGLEGHRVEVVTMHDERRRFIVGKSTGPIPCHLEVKRIDSSGGTPADREYKSVKVLERVR